MRPTGTAGAPRAWGARWRLAWSATLVWLVLLAGGWPERMAQAQASAGLSMQQQAWVEPGRSATVADVVLREAGRFVPVAPQTVFALGPERTLWLRLRLQVPPGAAGRWGLEVPVPLLDLVVLHQRGADGVWTRQQAGDSLPVAAWARPGRYATFELQLPPGQPTEVLMQVRQQYPVGFPLRVAPVPELERQAQAGYLLMGLMMGAVLLMGFTCLVLALVHREAAFAWYALQATLMTLTLAAVAGIGGHLLWDESPRWNHLSQGLLPVLMAGVNVLFVRHLCGLARRHPRLDQLALAAGLLSLALAAGYPLVDDATQAHFLSGSLVASVALTFTLGALAWRRGDGVGRWVVLAYLPMAAVIVLVLLRIQGWIVAGWLTLEGSALAAALAAPLLLLALNARSRDRLDVQTRANKLTQQDALTGLLSAPAFERQLRAAVAAPAGLRPGTAVALVELVNLPEIQRAWGAATAEQSVLRSVIKLHRVVRESEPAGRLGAGRFGLLLEGVRGESALRERLVRLVAAGLAPTPGAGLDVPLRFHVAVACAGQGPVTAEALLRELEHLLAAMSPRTRRPIRFLASGACGAPAPAEHPAGETAAV